MIDFRYHLVSLISVFLALAVGIVLGAGPMRDFVADSLSGQVEDLSLESEDLRAELEASNAELDDAAAFISATGPELIAEALPAYPVSIVVFPGVEEEAIHDVKDTLTEAGAHVENTITLTADLLDPVKRPFRSGISSNLTTYMDPKPGTDASTEAVIGMALDQALTSYDPKSPEEASADALAILELLRSADLLDADGSLRPTLLTVILTPETELAEEEQAAGLGLIKGTSATRTLVAGTHAPQTLLQLLRTDSDSADVYATIDSIDSLPGQLLLPRALAAVVDGKIDTYGFAEGATLLPPQVTLSAPEPIEPETDNEADADEEEDADADQ